MEEQGVLEGEDTSNRWVIDPLDGTTNFLHGIPHWAISIGLERRMPDGTSELAAGLVYAPAVDEMFWAEKGVGAFVNERRLRVSGDHQNSSVLDACFDHTESTAQASFLNLFGGEIGRYIKICL